MPRTIEVLPSDGHYQDWKLEFTGLKGTLYFDKKSTAVSRGRMEAKQEASKHGHSVGLKIFGKNGDYQRQHVYDP